MKSMKPMKKIMSILCSLVLVLSLCVVEGKPAQAAGTIVPDLAVGAGFTGAAVHTITLAASKEATDVTALTVNQPGVLVISMKAEGYLTSSVSVGLYSDATCTSTVGYNMYLSSSIVSDQNEYIIPVAGTYYLKAAYSGVTASTTPVTISYQAIAFSSEDTELADGSPVITYTKDYNKTVYHKIEVEKPGIITVAGQAYSLSTGDIHSLSIKLLDKNKLAITNTAILSDINNYTNNYVLKKGTYYISSTESSMYSLAYTTATAKKFAKAGASKKKALKLKKNKQIFNSLYTGENAKKEQWYKVTLPKSAKLKIITSGIGNNSSSYHVEVVPANPKTIITGATTTIQADGKGHSLSARNKFSKGTYYICIRKNYSTEDGVLYSLKVKY